MLLDFIGKAVRTVSPVASRTQRARKARYSQPLFCSQPFKRFEVIGGGQRGDTFSCCQSWVPRSIGNMIDQSDAEVWNSRSAQNILKSILGNSFRYCRGDVCPYLQRIDGPVQRLKDVTDPEMLAPSSRKRWCCRSDQARLSAAFSASRRSSRRTPCTTPNFSTSPAQVTLWEAPSFANGCRRRMPKLERIHLRTNALLWTQRIWDSIPEPTRRLIRSATISIDAASEEIYAVNRRGGEFRTLLNRLALISELRLDGPLEYLEFHMTVQRNNFQEMPAFELARRSGADRGSFHKLLDWGSFTSGEFTDRAVHEPTHPDHHAFLDMLIDPALNSRITYLSSLSDLAREASSRTQQVELHVV